jgi:hypothetical protein
LKGNDFFRVECRNFILAYIVRSNYYNLIVSVFATLFLFNFMVQNDWGDLFSKLASKKIGCDIKFIKSPAKRKKMISTWTSPVVTHPSTTHA